MLQTRKASMSGAVKLSLEETMTSYFIVLSDVNPMHYDLCNAMLQVGNVEFCNTVCYKSIAELNLALVFWKGCRLRSQGHTYGRFLQAKDGTL